MKKTNFFQDLWLLMKKWYDVFIFFFVLAIGAIQFCEAHALLSSADFQTAIPLLLDAWGLIISDIIFLACLVLLSNFSSAEPDKNNNDLKE